MGLFSRLPRELRDLIYTFYLVVDGGYVGDGDSIFHNTLLTKKHEQNRLPRSTLQRQQCILRRADRSSTDIALVFTCKSIAEEMYGGDLALRVNTITFSTFYSDELRLRAGRFNYIREEHVEVENVNIFQHLGECFWGPVYDELQNTYPIFMPLVDAVRKGKPPSNIHSCPHYGQARSLYSGFVKYALQLAAYYHPPEFVEAVEQHRLSKKRKRRGQFDPHHIAHCSVEAWDIPTRADLLHLASHTRSSGEPLLEVQVRRGVLPEDASPKFIKQGSPTRRSSPVMASSGMGYFGRLPREMRDTIYRSYLIVEGGYICDSEALIKGQLNGNPLCRLKQSNGSRIDLALVFTCKAISAEMGCGDLALRVNTITFSTFYSDERDAAWQQARQEARQRGYLPAKSFMELHDKERNFIRRLTSQIDWGYFYEDFPHAMKDLTNNNSIIRCNFDVGNSWDVEQMVQERRHHSESKWNDDWHKHEPMSWDTVTPQPKWKAMLEEDVVSRQSLLSPSS
ncbi:hypothetical protein CkaCkLH20_05620 [Colletotrichum karsti]|uniref:Uncharacterized protein n=1 Tax=Colletotrichum karsti TaxID=1095194 RepID=A0A9P6I693_9PEZI|nr:uncharacterized protein CkaCkLH20_05620 [Colletotrichum karsti]KAF9876774.1 hypothetical protein CkaCkLH20_05620 [Colletotrichum karsti]